MPGPRQAAEHNAEHVYVYDAIDPKAIPASAVAVAGYVNGRWPSLAGMRRRLPKALWVSITVTARERAMILDCESGDATVDEAVAWIRNEHRHAVTRPVVYTSLGMVNDLEQRARGAGLPRSTFRVWSAHYTGHPHICGASCGFPLMESPGMTQYESVAGRNYDVSLTTLGWLNAVRAGWHLQA